MCNSAERLAYLHSVCELSPPSAKDLLASQGRREMLHDWRVDEKHDVLVCQHQKVGLTTWYNILCNNTRSPDDKRHLYGYDCIKNSEEVFRLDDDRYSDEDILYRLEHYYKVMTVRHPLDRLVSAYRHCFRDANHYYRTNHGTKILNKYRKNITPEQRTSGKGVWFQEFIQYINDGYKDVHWRGPYDDKCHPCSIHFDAIVRIETFNQDVAPIIKDQLEGISADAKANVGRIPESGSSTLYRLLSEYQNVTTLQLELILQRYSKDFEQFGYYFSQSDDGSVQTGCSLSTEDGDKCC